jgi:hypothetical protein
MAYIFTLLMFRKPNKTTINKIKTTNFYRSASFRFSFIFRYFKVFKVSQIFTCGLSDLLFIAVGSLVVFVLREYILIVHILVSPEHKLCQIWNTCIVSFILLFKQSVDIYFNISYYQESYIYLVIIHFSDYCSNSGLFLRIYSLFFCSWIYELQPFTVLDLKPC